MDAGRTTMPGTVLAEIRQADYVVDVTNYWGENIDEKLLEDLGFEPTGNGPLDPACYKIWRRRAPERTAETSPATLDDSRVSVADRRAATSRTALNENRNSGPFGSPTR